MNLERIRKVLQSKTTSLDLTLKKEIKELKTVAIHAGDEQYANTLWCYETIFSIQDNYYKAFDNIHHAYRLSDELDERGYDSPKSKAYEAAWNELDHSDMEISSLEENFCIPDSEMGDFHIVEIEENIQKLLPLFPYRLFTSREVIIKREECSVCGKTISIRHPCEHKVGKLYMGEKCCRIVADFQLLNINIVEKPFDRYAIIKPQGIKFDFNLLDFIGPKIQPYSVWSYVVEKRLLPQYKKVGRNVKCPCGSGKKYKYCIRDDKDKHYEDHYVFSI